MEHNVAARFHSIAMHQCKHHSAEKQSPMTGMAEAISRAAIAPGEMPTKRLGRGTRRVSGKPRAYGALPEPTRFQHARKVLTSMSLSRKSPATACLDN
jgi:hypothetical protein